MPVCGNPKAEVFTESLVEEVNLLSDRYEKLIVFVHFHNKTSTPKITVA